MKDAAEAAALARLRDVVRRLRDPATGCAWDRERTLDNVMKPLRSEVDELAEALAEKDAAHIREELGDVLFNVLMIARVGEEAGLFALDDLLRRTADKIVGRHPHVFGDVRADTPEAAMASYLAAKAKESVPVRAGHA